MEEESRGKEKVVKRREEKARVRERIAKEKLHNNKFALVVSWVFFCFFIFFLFSGFVGFINNRNLILFVG